MAAGSSGIAISLADPAGVSDAAAGVVAAGIPLYTLNSGVNNYKDLGAVTHVGQTEVVAGNGAGERFNALGATHILCARQEQSNVALEERCEGLAETFNGTVTSEFVGLDANPDEQQNSIAAILQADPSIDGVLGVGPNLPLRALTAGEQAGRRSGDRRLRTSPVTSSMPSRPATWPSPSTSSSTSRATCRSSSCTCRPPTRTPLAAACPS